MEKARELLQGDKVLWATILLISLVSFLPVYSAFSNLQYVVGQGSVAGHFTKHAGFVLVGLVLTFVVSSKIKYKYIGGIASMLLPFVVIALIATLLQGQSIDGANASRWLKIPGTPIAFQTSTFAALVLMLYMARYLAKNREMEMTFNNTFWPLLFPIILVVGLILPANGSTAILIFAEAIILLFVGRYPTRLLARMIGICVLLAVLFIGLAKAFPDAMPNRIHTWSSRIDSFFSGDKEAKTEDYQREQALAAIVKGKVSPAGPGKSAFKQTLPQSSSDFIFAIIIEEYGYIGVVICLGLYLVLFWRFLVIATKVETFFGTLAVIGVGFPIIIQAFTNMAVAVGLIPVTGQPLPILSYGGTSMWVTYIALGIILAVSREIKPTEELKKEKKKYGAAALEDIA